jgi:RES domain-containing protein
VRVLPNVYVSLTVELPESSTQIISKEELDKSIKGWDSFPHHSDTRIIGTNLKNKKYLLMRIPSAVIQDKFNYIMNPLHPLSIEARIIETKPFIFDERLKTKK